jgi:hypothetical protein
MVNKQGRIEELYRLSDEEIKAAMRLSRKLTLFLRRKGKSPIITILALGFIELWIEQTCGVRLTEENREALRKFVSSFNSQEGSA